MSSNVIANFWEWLEARRILLSPRTFKRCADCKKWRLRQELNCFINPWTANDYVCDSCKDKRVATKKWQHQYQLITWLSVGVVGAPFHKWHGHANIAQPANMDSKANVAWKANLQQQNSGDPLMAEYCNQCSQVHFDMLGDFIGLVTPDDETRGLAALVLCEGCGSTLVNAAGDCISKQCLASVDGKCSGMLQAKNYGTIPAGQNSWTTKRRNCPDDHSAYSLTAKLLMLLKTIGPISAQFPRSRKQSES